VSLATALHRRIKHALERVLSAHIHRRRIVFRWDGERVRLVPEELAAARDYGVAPDIHRDDYIFRTLCALFDGDRRRAYAHYLLSGRTSAEKVRDLVARHWPLPAADGAIAERLLMLDFAAGYGGATRHFKALFPRATVAPMDIHAQAFRFNRDVLHLPAMLSHVDPRKLDLPHRFDVIFALSFFSHLPRRTFGLWLSKLAELTRVDGLLIFTTHGETSHRTLLPHVAVDGDGFGFIAESEQLDLSTADYGHAVTYQSAVRHEIDRVATLKLLEVLPAHWWTHQDAYVLRRTSGADGQDTDRA
jgi:SAM-dependent methyltransferase